MSNVVIIGAGLTGISTAYHLEKNNFFNYTLIEKNNSIGGLCSSIKQDGYTFDYTGHLLHTSDDYFKNLLHTIVGADQFNVIDRRSFTYSNNVYTPYPFQSNLAGLPVSVIADCLIGFIKKKKYKRTSHFIQWVNQQFGEGFARHFFIPYQTKIFAYDPHLITTSWTSRFVPETNLEDIIEGIQGITKIKGYNANFLYPKKGGILSWVDTFAQTLKNTIQTQTSVTSIDIKNKTITLNNGHVQSYDTLISTMPLDTLLSSLKERSNSFLRNSAHKLLCNSVINFNLGIKNRNISDKHWVYYPESHYPFYRIGFPHNFSDSMIPADCSSLYGEFSYLKQNRTWIKETTARAIAAVKKLYAIADEQIGTECIIPLSHGYVIYDQWREKNLNKILKKLSQEHIYSIGRYGAWKYSSMQEAVLEGKAIAESILSQECKPAIIDSSHTLPTHYKKEIQNNV